ncbi:MAG: hypothetical protein P4M11_03745 [Candidatus Pacebacteria bacterium]|nr:hypothetical protein [Candidatus Paceibacterota bacterium]
MQRGPYGAELRDFRPSNSRAPYVTFDFHWATVHQSHPPYLLEASTPCSSAPATSTVPTADCRELVAEMLRRRREDCPAADRSVDTDLAKCDTAPFLGCALLPPQERIVPKSVSISAKKPRPNPPYQVETRKARTVTAWSLVSPKREDKVRSSAISIKESEAPLDSPRMCEDINPNSEAEIGANLQSTVRSLAQRRLMELLRRGHVPAAAIPSVPVSARTVIKSCATSRSPDNVILRNEEWQRERKRRIALELAARAEDETRGCTFRPQLSPSRHDKGSVYSEYRELQSPRMEREELKTVEMSNSYMKISEVRARVHGRSKVNSFTDSVPSP